MSLEVNRYRLVVATERAVFFLGQMIALRTPMEFLRSTKKGTSRGSLRLRTLAV